jgi:glucose-6-phosphate 1-dehydrogenase
MSAPVIVIFGITGDLSKRKLLPALYHLLSQDVLSEDTKIIGVSRHALDTDELLNSVELCVLEKDNICDPVGIGRLRASLQSQQIEPTNPEHYQQLKATLDSFDTNGERERLLYMSIPPTAYAPIIEQLASAGLNDNRSRLLLEKPFGYDTGSATELIDIVTKHFDESQVYRIDHYLAKETAQNLLSFRLHNGIFTPLWNSEHIESIHVCATEKIGIEGRAAFYEQTGALRDLVQSHLLQLLAITMMDLPIDMSSDAVHLTKQYFMQQLQPADPSVAIRGQYEGYKDEVNNPETVVETYTKLHLKHTAERWQGTDIVLETGKGLAEKATTITITFRLRGEHRQNNLTFRIQPDEGIGLGLLVKEPGFEMNMRQEMLDFQYTTAFSGKQHIDAYERVLMDAIHADQTLFASGDEVVATWRVLQPLLDVWTDSAEGLLSYPLGANPNNFKA